MTAKWFVTVDKHCMYPNDPDAYVWTLSHDPNETGWETDSGYSGYGLLKRDAEELANAADRIEKLEAALQIYSCDCSLASEEEDCELGDWTMLSCGYRARKALEKKNA